MKHFPSILFVIIVSFCLCSCQKFKIVSYQAGAMIAINKGNFKEAERLYKKMVELEPKVAEHHWSLGTVYVSMKQDGEVRKEIEILRKMNRTDLADQLSFLLRQPFEE